VTRATIKYALAVLKGGDDVEFECDVDLLVGRIRYATTSANGNII